MIFLFTLKICTSLGFMLEVNEVEPPSHVQFAQATMLREIPTSPEMDDVLDAAYVPSMH